MSADHEQAERIIAALIPHKGHDGIPAAPKGVLCLRCNAEHALDSLAAQLAEAQEQRKIDREEFQIACQTIDRLEAQLAERKRELDQAVTILGTARPLDVMEPDEDLSIGECAERWRELIRAMVAAAHSDSEERG